MNHIFIAGCILRQPIRFSSLKYYITEIEIDFSQIKEKKNTVIALAYGAIGNKVFELYKKGDCVLIEGESLVIEHEGYNTDFVIYISNIQTINQTIKK